MNQAPPVFDAGFAQAFETLLRWRRDVRHFAPEPVNEQDMAAILRQAALAPSVGNAQPWKFVRVNSADRRERLTRHVDEQNALAAQAYAGQPRHAEYLSLKLHGLREAPVVMAVLCDEQTETGHGLGVATMPEMLRYSCVTAVHTMWLAARARGIGIGWVSICEPGAVAAILDVPPQWSLIALLCIGYPADLSETPELEQRGWQSREPLLDRLLER